MVYFLFCRIEFCIRFVISKENISKIQLTVSSDNVKAIKLYEKFGFKKIDFLEDEYGNGIHREFYEKKF